MSERLGTEDGRLYLWHYYSVKLLQSPFGYGLGFETIVNTELLTKGQRVPPHNTLLQAGMYAGFAGVGLSVFTIWQVSIVIARIRRTMRFVRVPHEVVGLTLAWACTVSIAMFGGLLSGDFNLAIITGLLLAGVATLPSHRATTSAPKSILRNI
jgi:hypothetical protein